MACPVHEVNSSPHVEGRCQEHVRAELLAFSSFKELEMVIWKCAATPCCVGLVTVVPIRPIIMVALIHVLPRHSHDGQVDSANEHLHTPQPAALSASRLAVSQTFAPKMGPSVSMRV